MSGLSQKISRRSALITLAAVAAVAATTREGILLSADPVGEEECHPQPPAETNLTSRRARKWSGRMGQLMVKAFVNV